jgi:hypothetical protein
MDAELKSDKRLAMINVTNKNRGEFNYQLIEICVSPRSLRLCGVCT